MANDPGMTFRAKLSYDDAFSPPRDLAFIRRQLPEHVASRGRWPSPVTGDRDGLEYP